MNRRELAGAAIQHLHEMATSAAGGVGDGAECEEAQETIDLCVEFLQAVVGSKNASPSVERVLRKRLGDASEDRAQSLRNAFNALPMDERIPALRSVLRMLSGAEKEAL